MVWRLDATHIPETAAQGTAKMKGSGWGMEWDGWKAKAGPGDGEWGAAIAGGLMGAMEVLARAAVTGSTGGEEVEAEDGVGHREAAARSTTCLCRWCRIEEMDQSVVF